VIVRAVAYAPTGIGIGPAIETGVRKLLDTAIGSIGSIISANGSKSCFLDLVTIRGWIVTMGI
jgi:hypothetical protein